MARLQKPTRSHLCFLSSAKYHPHIMEIIAQWFDDLDDVISSMRLLSERLRSFCIALIFLASLLLVQIAGVLLALKHPPLASATATILLVTLMYRSATAPRPAAQQTA
jgi:hypothetical protein